MDFILFFRMNKYFYYDRSNWRDEIVIIRKREILVGILFYFNSKGSMYEVAWRARQSISITLSVLFIRRLFKENLIYFTSTGFKMYPLPNELFVVILVFSSHQITWAPPPSSTRTMLLRLSFPLLMSTNSVCRRWLAATLKLELTKKLISSD